MSVALLSPIASNTVLPEALDHANHTAFLIQAKLALEEGQFPLKVAPFQHMGLRYPVFQFYSQTPYLVGGLVYKYLTPDNPWLALKIVYFAGLAIAAFFTFGTGQLLGFNKPVSVLMGTVYITAPYLLANIHSRGAYTEAFAQFLLPLISFTSIRMTKVNSAAGYFWAALAWLLLGTSHLITFIYSSLFFVLLVVLLLIFRRIEVKTGASLSVSIALGWMVSAFQWYPAATQHALQIYGHLGNMFANNWLTPISELLSFGATPPEPLGGINTHFLYPSIGVPILISIGGLFYFRRRLGPEGPTVGCLVILFAIAVFCSWSPFNFWKYLPTTFMIAQFPYRLLTYVFAIGTVLFGYFASVYWRSQKNSAFIAWLAAIVLFVQPHLPTLERNSRTLASLISTPDLGYGAADYLYELSALDKTMSNRGKYETGLPLDWGDGWLRLGVETPVSSEYLKSARPTLVLTGSATQLPDGCQRIDLTLDGSVIATKYLTPGDFEWRVPVSVANASNGSSHRIAFRTACGFVPHLIDPKSTDERQLWIRVAALAFENADRPSTMPLRAVRSHCGLVRSSVVCSLTVDSELEVQLPVLFYPGLLRITINGQNAAYSPSTSGPFVLVSTAIHPGANKIVASFIGSSVGNAISAGGILIVVVLTIFGWFPGKLPRTS
jgi:hypothetical protein